jgi:Ras-related protein Rab-11A
MENKHTDIDIYEIKDSYASEINNQLFKIVIVGDSGVGKSNILSRYIQDEFYKESKSTVGVELSTKIYKIKDSIVKVNIWDTAGQERYKSITGSYYKGARGAMIVYDITKKDTFESVNKWHSDIRSMGDNGIMVLLVGNKCDLNLLRQVDYSEAIEKSKKLSKKM